MEWGQVTGRLASLGIPAYRQGQLRAALLKMAPELWSMFLGDPDDEVVRGMLSGLVPEAAAAVQPGAVQPGVPDGSRAHVAWLVPPNDAVPIEVLSSSSALVAYLGDLQGRKVPVTKQCYSAIFYSDSLLAESKLARTNGSELPAFFSTLLQKALADFGSELTTSFAMGVFLEGVLEKLDKFSHVKLLFKIVMPYCLESSTSSTVTKPRTRPDTLLLSGNCTLLIGEDKVEGGMLGALQDIMGKFSGLSAIHYGPVGHILAYTAAGLQVQLHTVSLGKQRTEINPVTRVFDLSKLEHRITFVLTLAKVYLVLHCMATSLPQLLHRFPLFKPISTHSGTTLTFFPGQVTKHIACFGSFAAEHHTSFEEVQATYRAANAAGRAAAASGMPPWLACACDGPKLNAEGMFKVGLQPVGYRAVPTNEHELRGMALACCSGLAALHTARPPLVHRDIRPPNVVRLVGGTWLLVDLEQAAYAARLLPADYLLSDWDEHTLEPVQQASQAGQQEAGMLYTPRSDMYQLGKMLRRYGVADLSPAASAFIAALIAKQLTAQDALQHPWLQQQQ